MVLILSLILLCSPSAIAYSLEALSQSSAGSSSLSLSLGLGKDDFYKNLDPPKNTIYDIDFSHSTTTEKLAADVGSSQKTTSSNASLVWSIPAGWRAGFGLGYFSATADNIYSTEGSLILGYRYTWENPPSIEEDKLETLAATFEPSLGFSFQAAENPIYLRRNNLTRLAIIQSWQELSLDADPWHWLSVSVSARRYTYNRNVAEIVALLDLPEVQEKIGSGLANNLATLQDVSQGLDLGFHVGDFDIDLSQSNSKEVVSQTTYMDSALSTTYHWKKWSFTLGVGQSKSALSASASRYSMLGARWTL